MKIFVTGTRGFPGIMGGVETHCCELYPRLAARGFDVTVARRNPYVKPDNRFESWHGVELVDLYAPKDKHFEAITHTLLSVFKAKGRGADILHIHGIGPGLVAPLARILGMKVVLTVHSFNYDHDKWNAVAKKILRIGEWAGLRWANKIISISEPIRRSLSDRYPHKDIKLIFNGVNHPMTKERLDAVAPLEFLTGKPYILALGRLVPEKGFDILIEAYRRSGLSDRYDLVIAGAADHPTPYSDKLKEDARNARVIMPGYINGERLHKLLSEAALFVLPSYAEGLPIALLEAMSYGRDVVASDIEPNRLPQLEADDYFSAGDAQSLADKLISRLGSGAPRTRRYDLSPYDWNNVAEATAALYQSI